ncbi:MAG: type II secretion system F family protein [Lachnospiraceae bacterium]|nr:type II secretion system F family protein [Lachnospiraceae bacterium]
MPNFKYTAYDSKGKEIKGTIEASDMQEASKKIKAEGNTPISVNEEGLLDKDLNISFGGKKVKVRDLSVFCRQFVSIVRSGVAIVDALEMLAMQTENPNLQGAIQDVMTSVQKGDTLANSMRLRKDVFPNLLITMVEAGEASGSLEIAFDRMGTQFEKDAKLKGMMKKALMYPIAIMVVVIVVVIAMMMFVIPTFADMYADMGQELPLITRMVVGLSNFLIDNWLLCLIGVFAIAAGYKVFARTTFGSYLIADISRKVPVFGVLTVKSASASFARTLSTLVAAGVSMMDALEITAKTMTNLRFRDAVMEAKEKVAQGRPLSEPLKASGIFPPMIVHMIGIGEETGNMEHMLDTAASYYEEEVENTTAQVATLLEPMIVVVMAVIVGVVIMAVLIPMFGMYEIAGES